MSDKNGTTVDVVVAGAGAAGLSAAITAAEAGAETTVLEKQPSMYDCTSAVMSGAIAFAGTPLQTERGIKDSPEALYKDIMDTGRWKNDPKLVKAYVDNQLDTFHWLTKMGIKWGGVEGLAGMSFPRAHLTDPVQLINTLTDRAKQKGVRIVYGAKVSRLLVAEADGVTGVKAKSSGNAHEIKARRGVVLATGGFQLDKERLKEIDPRYVTMCVFAGGKGCTGDGHRMAKELGAYERDIEYVRPSFSSHASGVGISTTLVLYYYGAILVNKRGERFTNESISYKDIGQVSLDQPDGIGFQIFDQTVYDEAVERTKNVQSTVPPEFVIEGLDGKRASLLVVGDSIEDLAVHIGVPPDNLKRTIDKYNRSVDEGEDPDFGRKTLVGNLGTLVKIARPKYYAFATRNRWTVTYGGVAVDDSMHVLKQTGIVDGLYATGSIVGGFHGASYHTGTSVGKSLIFGRIAGRNAALRR